MAKTAKKKNPTYHREQPTMHDCASLEGEFGARFFGVRSEIIGAILQNHRILNPEES